MREKVCDSWHWHRVQQWPFLSWGGESARLWVERSAYHQADRQRGTYCCWTYTLILQSDDPTLSFTTLYVKDGWTLNVNRLILHTYYVGLLILDSNGVIDETARIIKVGRSFDMKNYCQRSTVIRFELRGIRVTLLFNYMAHCDLAITFCKGSNKTTAVCYSPIITNRDVGAIWYKHPARLPNQ